MFTTRSAGILALIILLFAAPAWAQEAAPQGEATEEAPKVWGDKADLGFVLVTGNSPTSSLSFDNVLTGTWTQSVFTFRMGMYRQDSDEITRFAVQNPDGSFTPYETSVNTLDAFRVYVNTQYEKNISDRFFWLAGLGWDRDVDAGIESRTIGHAGVGNSWADGDEFQFKTTYGVSYTIREDEIDDPDVDRSYFGLRLGWDYLNQLFDSTSTLTNGMQFFFNVENTDDYRFINTTALTTSLTTKLALRLSAEFRYENLPALESVDLFDIHPDDGGVAIDSVLVRKDKLDSVFKVTAVVNF